MLALLPGSVKVGGMTYRISTADGIDEGCTAQVHFSKLLIRIDGELPLERIREGLLHELIHASLETWSQDRVGGAEEFVTAASFLLFAILTDNPGVADFILGRESA